MNTRDQERLDLITAKEPEAVTETELGFLRARASYLSKSDSLRFMSILEDKNDILLVEHTRAELDAMATELGLNPEDYQNKTLIAKAIEDIESVNDDSKTDQA